MKITEDMIDKTAQEMYRGSVAYQVVSWRHVCEDIKEMYRERAQVLLYMVIPEETPGVVRDDSCVFCKKIDRGYDEHGLVAETIVDSVVRFDPLNPVTKGHTLFVPSTHAEVAEQNPGAVAEAVRIAVEWASSEGIKQYNIIQSNGADATQTVGHVHVHLIPRRKEDNLPLPWDAQHEARV